MEKQIPRIVVDIMTLINNQNKKVFIVGGAVRDFIIGKIPKDYDLCTNHPLLAIKEQIPNFHLMKQTPIRNAGVIRMNDIVMEISELKGETLEDDILKRDFTINGIAMDIDGNIIDPYNFQTDIEQKRISLIDKTGESIRTNPLLMLRAIRLACQLDFEIDEETKNQMKKNKLTIARILGQRIYLELAKMIVTDKFPKYLDEYFDIFIMIVPELININFEDIEKRKKLLSIMPNNIYLKIAALFSYNGNPTQDFTQFANRMMLDKKTTKIVLTLLSYKNKELDVSRNGISRAIHEFNVQNVDLLFAYKKALMSANNECTTSLDIVKGLYQSVVDQVIESRISNLQLNLDKLVEMGYTRDESTLILEDVKGRVITCSLQNDERSINSYVLNNYKRS